MNAKLPVKLIVKDNQSDIKKVPEAIEKLIVVRKVDFLLSTHSSPLVVAGATVADKFQKYYCATTCFVPLWKSGNFQYSTLFFFDLDEFGDIPFHIWKSLPPGERVERPCLLYEDSPDGKPFAEGMRIASERNGIAFTLDEPWKPRQSDYTPLILKIHNAKIDAIFMLGSPHDCITLIRQMKTANVNVKYIHGVKGTWSSEFWKGLGKDAQYILCDGFWSADFPYPGAADLGKRFFKKFNKYSVSAGLFYATAQILFAAIEQTGSLDSKAVRDKVANGEFKGTVMGDVKYKDGVAIFQATASQWWNGKQMLVYPKTGTWKLKMAPPWNRR